MKELTRKYYDRLNEKMIPETTLKAMDIIAKTAWKQNQKGLETYGETIDQAKDSEYNWNTMAIEELIDAMHYMVKENRKLKKQLEMASGQGILNMLEKEYRVLQEYDIPDLQMGMYHAKMMTEHWLKGSFDNE